MKLQRINQVLEGIDFHYILINHFKILDDNRIDDLNQFTLDFINSKYFLKEYLADTKKEEGVDINSFLPFAFEIEKLDKNDFKFKEESITSFIEKSLIDGFEKAEFEMSDNFFKDFKFSIEKLDDYLKIVEVEKRFSIIDINDYPNTSEKVAGLYQEMGYIVDYFYFGIIPLKNRNEFVTFELAYE